MVAALAKEVESLADLLLKLPLEHSCQRLLSLAVREISAWDDVALVRIWQLGKADICESCALSEECPQKVECMHLVASSGRSIANPGEVWSRLDGRFSRFPIGVRKVGHVAQTGQSVMINLSEDRSWVADPKWAIDEGVKGINAQPLLFRGKILGVLGIFVRREIDRDLARFQRMVADHLAMAIANAEAFEKIRELHERLELENQYLRDEVEETRSFGEIVGRSEPVQHIISKIELVSGTDASVLVTGESGTGKELIAREIHRRSQRKEKPLIRVNCAGIPASLFESELFGHAKGAFTGALRDRPGRFEAAAGGTLFLDEIGEMPIDLQAKLLRVLQEGQYERVGEDRTRHVDVRIIAATNRDLRVEVAEKRFREDLFYRLNVFPIEAPPLRERSEDIPSLVAHFLKHLSKRHGMKLPTVSKAQLQALSNYNWPGNVRELQNQVERALITSRGKRLHFEVFEQSSEPVDSKGKQDSDDRILNESQMVALQRRNILKALKQTEGQVYGAEGASALLGLKPSTLASRMKKLGIELRSKQRPWED
ncbi:sigma 54-interacting transcriptional regulator [Pelagicoccus sp. SDUM812003]|uniref:sigma 54-interacting transcriptional regulator n=1 Tax=Pelagicoccus sp. SDUM812003 TaxID=3041267 RepID=UPI00280D9E74|nr:sigma 54-interacting transcriptional regulator [Pelagicoccus sp. SDUM812003]MDQ8202196.1 sigma 54-interacting transcriptional regulator [Pelagicoccus sp. SDUM812003]